MAAKRALRADAQRNREAILAAARSVFEREGIRAPTDAIATVAGVGNATLYRNFPTRDDLLASVMVSSVQEVLEQSIEVERRLPPAEALREWLYQLAWRLRIWNDLPSSIAAAIHDHASPMQIVCGPLISRTEQLLTRAREEGVVTHSVTAPQLFELITTVSWGIDRFGDDPEGARARVDLAAGGIFTGRSDVEPTSRSGSIGARDM
ncbi:TetR/AcrR family transcriptional regulator [Micromonospora sp. NPDC049366]|uniref:TetR/AcrR family transcriptional regulator n=1 Tax=Micromonospora sp. NPDC049366 TaxID=3364271 RepID=UPI0037B4C6BC